MKMVLKIGKYRAPPFLVGGERRELCSASPSYK